MKRIAFLTDNLLTIGGVQRVLAVIAIALSKNHKVTIITLEDTADPDFSLYGLEESDVEIVRFHPTGKQSILHKAASGIYKKLRFRGERMSEIYAHSSFPSTLRKQYISLINQGGYDTLIAVHGGLSVKLASIRNKLNVKKILGWTHNSYEAFFLNSNSYYPGLEDHFRHQLKKLDKLIVLCNADAKLYEERMHIRPCVIYNPLTLTPGTPASGLEKRFLSVGRMTPLHKGFDILIDAFAIFAREDKDWTLQIVGEGPDEENLRRRISEHGLEERISLSPFTSDIQKFYSNAGIYVMASRWEGMPLVLVEALSHGLPVIAPTLPVAMEILSEDVATFFPTGDAEALSKCMLKQKLLLGKKSVAIEYSKHFLLENIIKMWEENI